MLGSVSHADAVDVLSNTTVPLCLGLCGQTETDKWAVVASAIQLGHVYRVRYLRRFDINNVLIISLGGPSFINPRTGEVQR